MNRLLAVLFSVLALALVAAGCGGDDNSGGGGGGNDSAKTQDQKPKDSAAKKGKTVPVVQKNIQFAPKSVSVAAGGTVKWTNEDSTPHDVTKQSGPGPEFASGQGNMQQGDTYEQTFKTPGTIKYKCTIHPGMEGTVTVK